MDQYQIIPVGDQAVEVDFPNQISPTINRRLHQLGRKIMAKASQVGGLTIIPAYRTLLVSFDGTQHTAQEITDFIDPIVAATMKSPIPPSKTWLIPVLYGGQTGPDLADVAKYGQMSPSEAIKTHTSRDYLIYFLGFLPGFAYMASVTDAIAMPRLQKPRLKIAAGSVGIAGHQTGFYPVASPGGWRIIGQTPLQLYDPHHPQSFYAAGDSVRFYSINEEEFKRIQAADRAGQYQVRTVKSDGDH